MSTNGQLVFTDVDKITFKGVGNASNAVVDTLTGKIGVGTDSPEANLHVLGNSYVSTNLELGGTLIMGTVNVESQHSLEAVTATGNITPLTLEFTNPTTSLVASGNVEVGGNVVAGYLYGDGSNISGISSNLDQIVNIGNVTSNTVQFTNATTGIVTTANVEVGGELTVSGNVAVDTNTLFVDTTNNRVGVGTDAPTCAFDVAQQHGEISLPMVHFRANRDGASNGDGNVLKIENSGNRSDVELLECVSSGNSRFVVKANGNIGAGTTTPGLPLEIYTGNGNNYGLRLRRYPTGSTYTDLGHLSSPGTEGLAIKTSDGNATTQEVMRICGNGRVGIGISSPDAKLHVSTSSDNHNATDNALIIGGPTNCTGNTNLRLGCHTSYAWIQSHCGNPLRLNPGGNTVQYGTGNSNLSDDRIKDNEMYIENATDTLLKLKPQVYDKKIVWNISDLNETANGVGQELNIVRESGLITQDVWYDTPELRHLVVLGKDAFPTTDKPFTDNNPQNDPDYSSWGDEVSTLDYVGLIPYLVKSNQEIYTELQAEKAKVITLESQLASVLTRLDALENA